MKASTPTADHASVEAYTQAVRSKDRYRILLHGSNLLVSPDSALYDDLREPLCKEDILESVFYVACYFSVDSWAQYCLNALKVGHKDSSKVRYMEALAAEAKGDFPTAHSLYKKMVSSEELSKLSTHRLIAIEKSLDHTVEAVNLLIAQLESDGLDAEAWNELAQLYLQAGMKQQSLYCLSEVILQEEDRHRQCALILRSAQILENFGDHANALDQCRKAYALSLDSPIVLWKMVMLGGILMTGATPEAKKSLPIGELLEAVKRLSSHYQPFEKKSPSSFYGAAISILKTHESLFQRFSK